MMCSVVHCSLRSLSGSSVQNLSSFQGCLHPTHLLSKMFQGFPLEPFLGILLIKSYSKGLMLKHTSCYCSLRAWSDGAAPPSTIQVHRAGFCGGLWTKKTSLLQNYFFGWKWFSIEPLVLSRETCSSEASGSGSSLPPSGGARLEPLSIPPSQVHSLLHTLFLSTSSTHHHTVFSATHFLSLNWGVMTTHWYPQFPTSLVWRTSLYWCRCTLANGLRGKSWQLCLSIGGVEDVCHRRLLCP